MRLGALAAVTVRTRQGLIRALAWARPVALAGGAVLLLWFVIGNGLRGGFFAQTAGYSVIGATAAAILVLGTTAAVGSRRRAVLTNPTSFMDRCT